MPPINDAQVIELLEAAMDSERTPEEVCAACPEMLPEVRRRLAMCVALNEELLVVFPSPGHSGSRGPGTIQGGRSSLPDIPGYDVIEVLGRGGMGVVYKARHRALNRFVAIKMLLSGAYARPAERARFKREAESLAVMKHPNIVQVHDIGEFDGRPFFTMEFVDGRTLADALVNVPQSSTQSARILVTLAAAVASAHLSGIIHRDLKPSNVLLSADGTPKISDFGLARLIDDEDSITLGGARLGTPSYMAPEQAAGRSDKAGAAADIYALGAILYEMLTGRPPFRGESPAETERQLLNNEPALPSHLNARVPRDLETICLKCLSKSPARRYATADALREELERFLHGEPILARRVGRLERGLKWIRRRPAAAALWAAGLTVLLTLSGGWLVWESDRAAAVHAFEVDLREAAELERAARWNEAGQALNRAELRLGNHKFRELRKRLEDAHREADLVPRLEAIRMNRAKALGRTAYGEQSFIDADRAYAALFDEAGLGTDAEEPGQVVSRIIARNVRCAIVASMYEWMRCARDPRRLQWLSDVVEKTDPDPGGWRDRALNPATWSDAIAAQAVLSEADLSSKPPELLLLVYNRARKAKRDALPFLQRVQRAHPTDFWVNMSLEVAMTGANQAEAAARYAQAAVVLRPDAAIAHNHLGNALNWLGRVEEAISEQRESLRLEPDDPYSHYSLAYSLATLGRHAEAAPEFELCLRVSIDNIAEARQRAGNTERSTAELRDHQAAMRTVYGQTLEALGRFDEAEQQYRIAVTREPSDAVTQMRLAIALTEQGKWDEALEPWLACVSSPGSSDHRYWSGFPERCLFAGKIALYEQACEVLLDKFETCPNPRTWETVGRACLLREPPQGRLQRATALIDRLIASDSVKPTGLRAYFLVSKGLAEYRRGDAAAAVATMTGEASRVHGPTPQLVIAMAESSRGRADAAREALVRAVLSFDWRVQPAQSDDVSMYHILRREAERCVLPNFQDLLDGSARPADNCERLVLLGACQASELHGREAQIWADAIAADPKLAQDYAVEAARAAVRAAASGGRDAERYTAADRDRWREMAVALLLLEDARMNRMLDGASPDVGDIQAKVKSWQTSPEFACVRDARALADMSASERAGCRKLWDEVSATLARAETPRK